jgi:hypothetical protein
MVLEGNVLVSQVEGLGCWCWCCHRRLDVNCSSVFDYKVGGRESGGARVVVASVPRISDRGFGVLVRQKF